MKPVEMLKQKFSLSDYDAAVVTACLRVGEEVVDIDSIMLDWLKEDCRKNKQIFLALTTEKKKKMLYIYVRTYDDLVIASPFGLYSNHPLEELWRAIITSDYNEKLEANYLSFVSHRPN